MVKGIVEHEIQISDQVVNISVMPGRDYHHSEFPHELLTVDYDDPGNIIAIETVGPYIPALMAAYAEWVIAGEFNPATLVELVIGKVNELRPNPKEESHASEGQAAH